MPIHTSRRLTGRARTPSANRQLGLVLAFIAGATNAGAFLAVRQYTSHMTGLVSAFADDLVLGQAALAAGAAGAVVSFVLGAATCAILVNHARRHALHSEYAVPLLLEALLLLVFGVLGAWLSVLPGLFVPGTVMLLCFTMGLQNAVISKISNAEIRTTHVTGIVTDIGIELGKLVYWNRRVAAQAPPVHANLPRLATLAALLAAFVCGGVVGAVGFQRIGYAATVPLALTLVVFGSAPAWDDLAVVLGRWRGRP